MGLVEEAESRQRRYEKVATERRSHKWTGNKMMEAMLRTDRQTVSVLTCRFGKQCRPGTGNVVLG